MKPSVGKPSWKGTSLYQKKETKERRDVLGCDVTGLIAFVLFSVADMRHTLCNVGNDGQLDFGGLGVDYCQCQRT